MGARAWGACVWGACTDGCAHSYGDDRRREAPGREEEADDGDHCEIVESRTSHCCSRGARGYRQGRA